MKGNTIDWAKTDALIFDMDGTLWDAVDSYCKVWDKCFNFFGVEKTVSRNELISQMGKHIDEIYNNISGGNPVIPANTFIPKLEELEFDMMPELGGIPYKGVREGIELLSKKYVILLLSNCGVDGLNNLIRCANISDFITEAVTYGATLKPKEENMAILKEKYNLTQPAYVGDTEGDCRSTKAAGLNFVFAAYGFGECENPDISFNSFEELSNYFLSIK